MYSFESRVRYSETDESGSLSMLGMIDYLQDCSTFQSEDCGVGLQHLSDVHLGWFIANWGIDIAKLPKFGDRIVVSTWSYDISKIYGYRNFTIKSPGGVEYVRADSLWFMFDMQAQRPIKVPQAEAAPFVAQAGRRLDMPKLERKIAVMGEGRVADIITVNEQHLDTNHHVNNAQYVEMAVDAIEDDFCIGHLGVQYKTAAVLGDTIVPCVHDIDGGYVVDLADEAGQSFAVVKMLRAGENEADVR